MEMVIERFDIWLANLNPTIGSEIRKIRPCLIISPDEMNHALLTVVIVPLTSTLKNYPTRVNCNFKKRKGQLAVDQLKSLDKSRFIKKIGKLDELTCIKVCKIITETFSYE